MLTTIFQALLYVITNLHNNYQTFHIKWHWVLAMIIYNSVFKHFFLSGAFK